MVSRFVGRLFWTCLALSLSCACRVGEPPGGAPASPTLPLSVNEVMVAWIDPSGHELWDREGEGQAPKTESEWREVERHAAQLAVAGTVIALGGTGKQDPAWRNSPDWRKYSQELAKAGMAARDAAQSRSFDALLSANGELVQACENCHKAFKPELPTEGRAHQQH